MVEQQLKKAEIVSILQAQGQSTESISKRLVALEQLVDRQESRNKEIIYAVLVAFLLVVGTVAVEVLLSNKKDMQFYSQISKDAYEQNLKIQDLNNKIDILKIKNWLK